MSGSGNLSVPQLTAGLRNGPGEASGDVLVGGYTPPIRISGSGSVKALSCKAETCKEVCGNDSGNAHVYAAKAQKPYFGFELNVFVAGGGQE
jgi:hypothetical protein